MSSIAFPMTTIMKALSAGREAMRGSANRLRRH
jgi:hypothetical protein